MSGLSREFRTCCRKQQNKIQPANKKSKREFFRRENTKCTFSSRRHLCFRLGRSAAQNPTLPDRQHILFRRQPANIFHFHSPATAANPSIAKCFFAASVFQTRKHEVHIWQHPKPSFPAWPANISRHHSFHTGPHNPQSANSLPPGLAGRRLTLLPTTFTTSTKCHLPTKYRSPPFFKNPPIAIFPNILPTHLRHLYITIPSFHTSSFFYFLYRRHPPGFRLSVPPSHHFPNALHFFRPAAAFPNSSPNAKRSFARGCSLQGCRGRGRGARVSSFFFMFLFSASLFSLSFSISLAPRLRRDAFIFLFAFVFLFVFFFLFFLLLFLLFSFCFFLFIFLLIFYSCFSLSFLFTFSFFLLLLLSLFSLFFFSLFFHFFTFAFFLFVFLFALFLSLLLSLFFVFLFALLFYPPHSNLFPHYPTARRPFVFSPPPPIFPIHSSHFPAAAKKKKISAKESTGVEWPPGSERAAGGKTEGRD